MNGIAEGVRQLRGASVNQVPDVEHVLVTAGTGVPTSGLILGLTHASTCFVRGHVCTGQLPSRCRSRFGSESSPNPGSPLGEVAKRMRWARDATVPGPG